MLTRGQVDAGRAPRAKRYGLPVRVSRSRSGHTSDCAALERWPGVATVPQKSVEGSCPAACEAPRQAAGMVEAVRWTFIADNVC